MRRVSLLTLIPFLAAVPLAAQGFEGTVMVKLPNNTDMKNVEYFIKGSTSAVKFFMPPNSPAAGKEGRMIIDGAAMKRTMLIPMEMGGMKGMKQVTDLKDMAPQNANYVVHDLGTTETIAGYRCKNYEAVDGKNKTTICVSSELGPFAMPGMGSGMRGNWAGFFANHPGFPLRVTDGDGKVIMEVTGVKIGPVPADIFVIPDGYMEMPNMGGGRGRGPGGM